MTKVEMFYESNGIEIVDLFEFEDGTYVNTNIKPGGIGYVRATDLCVIYQNVIRIKMTGPYRGSNGDYQHRLEP